LCGIGSSAGGGRTAAAGGQQNGGAGATQGGSGKTVKRQFKQIILHQIYQSQFFSTASGRSEFSSRKLVPTINEKERIFSPM
jgi:hypothetical protein